MAVSTTFIPLVIRGNDVSPLKSGMVCFYPTWGIDHVGNFIILNLAEEGKAVRVIRTDHGIVAVPDDGQPTKELVLVKAYTPGSGAKRWPKFSPVLGPEVTILSEYRTCGGSGSEEWYLIIAPIGWADNIAAQFINERDAPGQTPVYNPAFVPPTVLPEEELSFDSGNFSLSKAFESVGL